MIVEFLGKLPAEESCSPVCMCFITVNTIVVASVSMLTIICFQALDIVFKVSFTCSLM